MNAIAREHGGLTSDGGKGLQITTMGENNDDTLQYRSLYLSQLFYTNQHSEKNVTLEEAQAHCRRLIPQGGWRMVRWLREAKPMANLRRTWYVNRMDKIRRHSHSGGIIKTTVAQATLSKWPQHHCAGLGT